ncbi:hypothetical protein MASR2M18_07080 [Ignavibacteria bacterium]|nr:OmpA family protein [Bacteroidota bacterium]
MKRLAEVLSRFTDVFRHDGRFLTGVFTVICALLIIGAFLAAITPAHSQQLPETAFEAACMSRNTGYILQTYASTPTFPAEMVNQKWNEGYRITSVAQGDGLFHIVMSNPGGYDKQGWISSDTLPLNYIDNMWDNGFSITNLCYGNGKWTFIFSQIIGGAPKQILFYSREYPYNFMDSMMKNGYRVNSLVKGGERWIVVMQNAGVIQFEQSIYKTDTLDVAELRQKIRRGYRLSFMHHSDRVWTAVVNGYSRYGDQVLLSGDEATKDKIKQLWDNGYRITDIAAGQTFIVVDLTEKHIEDRDIYSESVNLVEPLTDANREIFRNYIHRKAPSDFAYFAAQKFAVPLIKEKKYAVAADTLRQFLPLFPDSAGRHSKIEQTIALLLAPEENLPVSNLGPNINGVTDEWDPCPTADGHYLYFSTNGRVNGEGGQDVFVAEADTTAAKANIEPKQKTPRKQKQSQSAAYPAESHWTAAKSVGRTINSRGEETIDNVSADGNTLYLSGAFRGTYGKFDIFTAEKTPDGWGRPMQIPRPVNSEFHEEAGCLSADGQFLIFTSDRPGGIGPYVPKSGYIYAGQGWGNSDIYVSQKTTNGWSAPINLGSTINTPFAESSVFLHPDGKTMYFCSNGHYGLGGLDIYKATRLSDTSWTQWSEPLNIGKLVNTAEDDWGYKVTVDGERAYFAARNREGGYGGWDIFSMPIPKQLRPENVVVARGKVVDARGIPIGATIRWEDLSTGKIVGSLQSDPQTGMYFIALPGKKLYGYYAEKSGYYSVSKNADLRKSNKSNEYRYDITLVKALDLSAMPAIPINNIFFDYDSYELKSESYSELSRLADFLKNNPEIRIEIGGHTDDQGSAAYNMTLSQHRAEAVRERLISLGCSAIAIAARGYGKTRPVSRSTDEQARAQNRRVEFTAINNKNK